MVDVIVCVMVYPQDTTGMDETKANRIWKRGDIVDVYESHRLPNAPNLTIRPNGTGPGRLRYIRLSGVPSTFGATHAALTERIDHDANPDTPGRNRWKGDALVMLTTWPDKYAELRDTGVTSLTWAEAKQVLKDVDDTLITDADVV